MQWSNISFRKEAVSSSLLFLLCLPGVLPAQYKEANNWFWGMKAGLTFNTTPPSKRLDSQMGFATVSAASISDSAGNLLFYTRDDTVWNANHTAMPHGKGIRFDSVLSSYSSAIIIPWLGKKRKYWVFYTGYPLQIPFPYPPNWYNHAICGYVVDISLNGGMGDVDTTTLVRLYGHGEANITCMLHANGKANWLVGRRFNSDTLLAWKVDSSGLQASPVKSKVFSVERKHDIIPTPIYYDGIGSIKASPNSEMLFWGWDDYRYRRNLLLKFDREAGTFSNRIYLVDSVGLDTLTRNFWPNDAVFSPDNRFLYTCENLYWKPLGSIPNPQNRQSTVMRQYSLETWDSAAIKNSARKIYKTPLYPIQGATTGPMTGQLGPDGKIYFQQIGNTKLSVINCPSSEWTNVKFEYQKINIERDGGFCLPTLNQTFVRNAGIFQVQANKRKLCVGDTLEISGYGAGAEHFTWSVSPGLPQGIHVDTLTWQKIPTQTIPPGSYTFTCQASSRCGDVFEKSITVQINPNPGPPVLAPPLRAGGGGAACLGDSVFVFVANPAPGTRYFWSTGQIADTIVVKQSGKYALDSVANGFGCGIRVGDSVLVTIKNLPKPPPPLISGPSLVEICEGQTARLKVETQNAKVVWSNGVEGDSVVVAGGQYSVISESDEGCQSAASEPVTVVEVPNPTPVFVHVDSVLTRETLENQNYCVAGMPGTTFSFSVEGGTIVDSSEDCVTIQWAVDSRQFTVSVMERMAGLGCEGVAVQQVSYRPQIQIPTLITPNTDDRNDTFVIEDLEFYPNHHLQIFNRWGKKVLETHHYQNDWKGEEGIYFYNLVVGGMEMKGWVQVIK